MNVTLINAESITDDNAPLLAATLQRLARHENVADIRLHLNARSQRGDPVGWLEFLAVVEYAGGSRMTIGCIQRIEGGSFEFHS